MYRCVGEDVLMEWCSAAEILTAVVSHSCTIQLQWKDMDHFRRYLVPAAGAALEVEMEYLEERQLLAVQGKAAAEVLQRLVPAVDFGRVGFMTGLVATPPSRRKGRREKYFYYYIIIKLKMGIS